MDEQPSSDLPRRVVLVTGLSGAGKASILRILEDIGYEAVDNAPIPLLEELIGRGDRPMAIGVDARSRGFDAAEVLSCFFRLKLNPALRPELVFAWAEDPVLLRRFTETRRRHPLAPRSRVADGLAIETTLMAPLKEAADLVVDTSNTPLSMLRRDMEQRFSEGLAGTAEGMTVSLMSFAYPEGLPRDADLIFDARFLKNPHYDPLLRPKTGLDPEVAAFVESDPDYPAFMAKMTDLLTLLLPRFLAEGKKYVGLGIGCTGGRHRSVTVVQALAKALNTECQDTAQWRVAVSHRELLREQAGRRVSDSVPGPAADGGA
jgi:UPF0042 nucleotide-binding protein